MKILKHSLFKALPKKIKYFFSIKHKNTKAFREITESIFKSANYNDYKKGKNLIEYLLLKYFHELPPKFISTIKSTLLNLYYGNFSCHDFDFFQNTIVYEFSEINYKNITFHNLSNLQYLFLRFGLFQTYYLFRRIAIEKAINEVIIEASNENILNAFMAMIEANKKQQTLEFLSNMRNIIDSRLYNEMQLHCMLCFDSDNKTSDFINSYSNRTNIDKDYFDLIHGKSIAIVGPAQIEGKNGKEIDSFDIVVRLGYKGNNFDFENFGQKTDISYYSIANYKMYLLYGVTKFLDNLKFSNFKNSNYLKIKELVNYNKCRMFKKNRFFLFGSPTMMQHATYDILHFGPSKIKLFNINFYLSTITHSASYKATSEERSKYDKNRGYKYYNIWKNQIYDTGGFAHHDLISQVNFIRNLWKNNIVNVDNTCENILRMRNFDYLKEMENIYIKPFCKSPIGQIL